MKDTGMYGGTFNPLHLGHVNDIIEAACICKKLYVVLSVSDAEVEIDYKIRYRWLKQITADMQNVDVIIIFDNSLDKAHYDWEAGAKDIKKKIGKPLDIVFCGNDYKESKIFEQLYIGADVHYFDRKKINISSTKIRKNPYKYYDFLPQVVREYYNKKVVVIGTESCGKSTLVRNLAKVLNTTYVEEVGREVCEAAGGIDNMMQEHYEEIIYKHKVRENEEFKRANKVLLIDTEALITLYYYNLAFGASNHYVDFNNLANGVAKLNKYDLWLFLEPDVEWVQDGTRTYGEEKVRKENNQKLKNLLKEHGINYKAINGNYEERYLKAKKYINEILR